METVTCPHCHTVPNQHYPWLPHCTPLYTVTPQHCPLPHCPSSTLSPLLHCSHSILSPLPHYPHLRLSPLLQYLTSTLCPVKYCSHSILPPLKTYWILHYPSSTLSTVKYCSHYCTAPILYFLRFYSVPFFVSIGTDPILLFLDKMYKSREYLVWGQSDSGAVLKFIRISRITF